MPRTLFLVSLLLAPITWIGCDSDPNADAFRLTLADAEGALVYTGDLRLTIERPGPADEPGEVTGRWRLDGAGEVPAPTPSAGAVIGSTSEGQIDMTLVVEASDSGYSLSGTYDGDRMAGAWSTITIAGPVPSGTFEALRE